MFSKLFKRLLPTGRAYNVGPVGNKLIDGTTDYFETFNGETDSLLHGVLPDNDKFTEEWASRWESFLDLPAYDFEPLQTRMVRIKNYLTPSNPNGSLITKQALQNELNLAGWNGVLFVHENPNGLLPEAVLPPLSPGAQLGNFQLGQMQLGYASIYSDYPEFFNRFQLGNFQLGQAQLGGLTYFTNKIANRVNRYRDISVNLDPLAHTFYICGPNLGDVVTLPASDEIKLRKLILQVKPASSVGFLLIKYI